MTESEHPDNGNNTDDLEIPEIIQGFLASRDLKREDLYEIAFEDAGHEAYFVLTGDHLFKIDAESGDMIEEIALSAITKSGIKAMVGGGLFEIYMGRSFKEIARFSNTRMKSFGRISKLINEYIKEDEIKDEGEADRDISCPTCKRPLPERDAICPFCLNRKKVLLRFMGFLKPYRFTALFVFSLLLIGLVLQMVNPQFIRFLLDDVFLLSRTVPDRVLAAAQLADTDVCRFAQEDADELAYVLIALDKGLFRIKPDGSAVEERIDLA